MAKHRDPTEGLPPGKRKADAVEEFNRLMDDAEKSAPGTKLPRIPPPPKG